MELVELFGEKIITDLEKCLPNKMCNIPIGDSHPSCLHLYPHLQVANAPKLVYQQLPGEQMCVYKSLASVVHNLGWEQGAQFIIENGLHPDQEPVKKITESELCYCQRLAQMVLPRWVKVKRMDKKFDWENDLEPQHMFLGQLAATDGSNSHAVTIHGGFVYDANEAQGLPLSKESLDYCTCEKPGDSLFDNFWDGYIFMYEGKKKDKCAIMAGNSQGNKRKNTENNYHARQTKRPRKKPQGMKAL